MKTIFKSLFTLVAMIFVTNVAYSQSLPALGVEGTVNVSARILKQITFNQDEAVNFGAIAQGAKPYIDPKDQNSTQLGLAYKVGIYRLGASYNEPIGINFPDTVQLTSGANHLLYRPRVSAAYGDPDKDGADTSRYLGTDSHPTLNDSPEHAVVTQGDGFGKDGNIVYTYHTQGGPAGQTFELTTLFIGGELHDSGYQPAPAEPVGTGPGITAATPTGSYSGTFTMTIYYSN